MQLHLVLGAVAATLLTSAPATAATPAWCKGGYDKPSYQVPSMFSETDPWRALRSLVAAYCYPDDRDLPPYSKQLAAFFATWSKRLHLTDADWHEVSEWAHLSRAERGQNTFFVTDRKAAWSAYTPLDQFALLSGGGSSAADPAYIADAFGGKLSQLGRLGYVAHCMKRIEQDDGPVALAMCASDAAALDMGKIAAELSADKSHGVADRMTARLIAYETLSKRAELDKAIVAVKAKDPAYEKMFELGVAAHKAWAQVDAKAVQLASDLDDARITGSRRASQGCMARAQDAWKAAVESIGAKRLGQIHGEPGNTYLQKLVALVIAEPTGYLAALALTECAALTSSADALARVIGASLARWPGYRGPRTGTQTAILTAGLELDQQGARIEYPSLARDWISGDNNVGTYAVAAVASVKNEGDTSIVTFAKQKVKQTRCTKGHYTSRISQIMSDGTVVYYYQCDKEITETVEVAPSPPAKVLARYAADIKPGMTVAIVDDVLAVAYPKGSTAPSIVTGVRVK